MKYYLVETRERSTENSILFWRADSQGYTSDLRKAGLYAKYKAQSIAKNSHGDTVAISKHDVEKYAITSLVVHRIEGFETK